MSARRLQASRSCSGAGLAWLCCGFSRFQIPARTPVGSFASAGAAAPVPAPTNDAARKSAKTPPTNKARDRDQTRTVRVISRRFISSLLPYAAEPQYRLPADQFVPVATRFQGSPLTFDLVWTARGRRRSEARPSAFG